MIEDWAVSEAVTLQEEAGLDVITDGEMRRLSFQSQMMEAVAGFGACNLNSFLWGEWRSDESIEHWALEPPEQLGVVSTLT